MGLAIESVKAVFSVLKKCPKVLILTLILTALTELSGLISPTYRLLLLPLIFIFSLLYSAAIPLIVKDAMSSKSVSLGKSLSVGVKKLHKVFGLMLLLILIGVVFLMPSFIIVFLGTSISSLWILLIAGLVFLLASIYIMVKIIFAMSILMIEDLGIIESLKKSWEASRNKFWSILGAFFLLNLLFIPYWIASIISAFVPGTYMIFLLIALGLIPSTLISLLPTAYYLKIKRRE